MNALAAGLVKDLLSSKKMAVLYILCSGFFWIFVLGVSRNGLEKATSSWGLDVNAIKDYVGANHVFAWIFCLSLLFSSLVVIAINFPFKEHQHRWYVLVTIISSIYIWSYGPWGVVRSFLPTIVGLYVSFKLFYRRKMYEYERIAERNGRNFKVIKAPMPSSVDEFSKSRNSDRKTLVGIMKDAESIAKDSKNKKAWFDAMNKYGDKIKLEPEISERRNKYNPIFPTAHHIKDDDVAYSGKVYIIKSIWLVPCGYLAGIATIAFGGIILGIISFAIPSSKN